MSVSDDTVVNPDLPADFQGELAYWDLELSLKGHYPQVILMGYLVDSSSHNMLWLGA